MVAVIDMSKLDLLDGVDEVFNEPHRNSFRHF